MSRARLPAATLLLVLALVPALATWWGSAQPVQRARPFAETGPLGADDLGRDVAVRLAATAAESVYLPLAATAALLAAGAASGIAIGLARPRRREWALRAVDTALVLPPMVFMLVVLAGLGGTRTALVVAVVGIGWASVTRLLAQATAQVAASAHLEAARAAGLGPVALVIGEVWPRVRRLVAAEAGLRLVAATQLVAVAGFLGFGSRDSWGAMVHDGLRGLGLNPWAALAPCLALVALLVAVVAVIDRAAAVTTTVGGRDA